MITKVNPYGHISLTNDYFSGLVEQAAKQCYGIAAMGQAPAESVVRSALRTGSLPPKGVTVTQEGGKLVIALHITFSASSPNFSCAAAISAGSETASPNSSNNSCLIAAKSSAST